MADEMRGAFSERHRHALLPLSLLLLGVTMCAAETAPERYFLWTDSVTANLKRIHAAGKTVPKSILNIGDSISGSDCFVWPWRTKLEQPGLLSAEGYWYQPKAWASAAGMESAWGRAIVPGALKKGNPEVATVLFGTNDLQHRKHDPHAFRANVEAIVDACASNGTLPILLDIPPAKTIAAEPLAAFNRELERLADERKIPLVRTAALFADHGGWQAMCFDGVHPNSKQDGTGGYDRLNDVIRALYRKIERDVVGREPVPMKPRLLETGKDGEQTIESYDRNGDGRVDFRLWQVAGQKIREEYDGDFDGRFDAWWDFKDGKLVSGKEDLDRDGQPDTPFVMKDGWKNETP